MLRHGLRVRVAPLSGGGRGLKLFLRYKRAYAPRRSSLRRGAWIETGSSFGAASFSVVAPLSGGGRGLKQTAATRVDGSRRVAPLSGGGRGLKPAPNRWLTSGSSRSSLRRGAWIETQPIYRSAASFGVAPLSGGGRGLKHCSDFWSAVTLLSLLSPEGGVD